MRLVTVFELVNLAMLKRIESKLVENTGETKHGRGKCLYSFLLLRKDRLPI